MQYYNRGCAMRRNYSLFFKKNKLPYILTLTKINIEIGFCLPTSKAISEIYGKIIFAVLYTNLIIFKIPTDTGE